MNINRLYKVEKIFGTDYDRITKVVLFSFNDIVESFYGKNSEADQILNKAALFVDNKSEVRFSSEMIADLFINLENSSDWLQKSFIELSENYKMYQD